MESTIAVESSEKEQKSVLTNPITLILGLLVIFVTAHTIYQVRRKGKTVGQALKDDAKLLATPTAVVAILGFVTGLAEYIIVNNVNAYGAVEGLKTGKIFKIPPKKELAQTAVTLLIVSIITGFLTDLALRMLPPESKPQGLHH